MADQGKITERRAKLDGEQGLDMRVESPYGGEYLEGYLKIEETERHQENGSKVAPEERDVAGLKRP